MWILLFTGVLFFLHPSRLPSTCLVHPSSSLTGTPIAFYPALPYTVLTGVAAPSTKERRFLCQELLHSLFLEIVPTQIRNKLLL